MSKLPDNIYKAAVDALYKARNDGKVMDQAAVEVVLAVTPLLREQAADEIAAHEAALNHDRSANQTGDYLDGMLYAADILRD